MMLIKKLGFLLSAIMVVVCFTLVYVHINGDTTREGVHIQEKSQEMIVTNTITSATVNDCVQKHSSKYIIGLNYWEQLNMAVHNLYTLVNLAVAWDGMVVKPYTMNSRLYGLPHLRADEYWSMNVSMLPLSWLFNEKNLDRLSCVEGSIQFSGFDQFLSSASRQVVILHYIFYKEAHELSVLNDKDSSNNHLYKRLISDEIFDCSGFITIDRIAKDILTSLNNEVNDMNYFKLLRHICINGTLETNPKMLATRTGIVDQDYITIIIVNWRGIVQKSTNHISAKGSHRVLRQFIHLPDYHSPLPKILYPSESVLYFTSQFVKTFSKGAGFIAMHIRSEKLGQRSDRVPQYITSCLTKTITFANEIKTSLTSNMKLIVITDYGVYGSDSCRDCKGAKYTRKILELNNFNPISFDPVIFKAPADSGFISLVELNTLLHSKYLILVGGGAFQKQAIMQFRNPAPNHHDNMKVQELYKVCWDDTIQIHKVKTKQII